MYIFDFFEYVYLFSIFIPESLKLLKGIYSLIYWGLEFIRLGISLYYITIYVLRKKCSPIFIFSMLLFLSTLISTIYNKSSLNEYRAWLNSSLACLGIICYFEIKSKENFKLFIKKITNIFMFLCMANFVFMLILPNGIYISTMKSSLYDLSRDIYIFFLAVKNLIVMWLLPLAALMQIENNNIKYRNYLLFNLMIFFQLLVSRSANSTIVLMIFHILIKLSKKNKFKSINLKNLLVVYTVLLFSVVVFRIQYLFEDILVKYLKKNVYLQGRVFIWDIAIEKIKDKWFIGYGNSGNGTIIQWNGYMWYAHNLILDILIQGGVVALFIFLLIFMHLILQERKMNVNKFYSEYNYKILCITLFSFLILGIFESYIIYPQFFLIISLTNYYSLNKHLVKVKDA